MQRFLVLWQSNTPLLSLSQPVDKTRHGALLPPPQQRLSTASHSKLPILKNTLANWIEAYLSLRKQCVQINDAASSPANVGWGIPQGSVLGPLLFIVFINIASDIRFNIKLFADDCILYNEICNSSDQADLNTSLAVVQTWCSKWQMTINLKKPVTMTVTHKKNPLVFAYSINNQPLSVVSSYKYFGVVITSDL